MFRTDENYSPWRGILVKVLFLALFVFLLLWLFPMPNVKPVLDGLFNENVQTMKDAAKDYYTVDRLPSKIGDSTGMRLSEMLNKKLILPFVDGNGEQCDTTESYVEVTKMEDDEYTLKVYLSCPNKTDYIIDYIGCYDVCLDPCEEEEEIVEKDPEEKTKKVYLVGKTVASKTTLYEHKQSEYKTVYTPWYKSSKEVTYQEKVSYEVEVPHETIVTYQEKVSYEVQVPHETTTIYTYYVIQTGTYVPSGAILISSKYVPYCGPSCGGYTSYTYKVKKTGTTTTTTYTTETRYKYVDATKTVIEYTTETRYKYIDKTKIVQCNDGNWSKTIPSECTQTAKKTESKQVFVKTKYTWSSHTSLSGWIRTSKDPKVTTTSKIVYYGGSNNWIDKDEIPAGYKIIKEKTIKY